MRRSLLALLVVLVLAGTTTVAAQTWDGAANGPRRTGAISFEGPQTNDTAFQVQLPGTPVHETLVEGDSAYVLTVDLGYRQYLDEHALWRVDLGNASVERAFSYPDQSFPVTVTSELALFQDGQDLVARDVPSGEERWRTRILRNDTTVTDRNYQDAALVGGNLYVSFVVQREADPAGLGEEENFVGVAAVDAGFGAVDWTWRRRSLEDPDRFSDRESPAPLEGGNVQVAADGERVYLYLRTVRNLATPTYHEYRKQYHVWAIEGGEAVWNRSDTEQRGAHVHTYSPAGDISVDPPEGSFCCPSPVVTDTRVLTRLDAFEGLNPATGQSIWTVQAGRADQLQSQGAKAMGVRGDAFIAATDQSIYRMDPDTGDVDWLKNNPSSSKVYGVKPVVVDDDTAYVPTIVQACDNEGQGMEARDLETGELLWEWREIPDFPGGSACRTPNQPGFGPGFMVNGVKDGTVTVVGETEASLGDPDVSASSTYPDEGDEVRVDLSGTEPGALGPATRYKADWGDGTTTDWQSAPVLTHSYNESGDQTARFWVGNDANQTSSTTQTFHVGEDPPPSPNMAQKAAQTALADGNVDITFGVLGLVMAVTGGAVGVARRRRKRSRLQDELDAIERAYVETKHNPIECEAQLTERKTHARGLLLDGELDESQFQVVENRVEELLTDLRKRSLDDEFDFLPHGLVKRGREMLEDGKVSALEADAFLRAVKEADMLSPEQKAVVRERIEEWRGRDAGGGGAG